jgi:tetratricopeptide (TPR) repeat protein
VISMACMLVGMVGCDELSARRGIQKGNSLYEEGRFAEAVASYEQALDRTSLPIGHYNAGLAYSRLFQAGVKTDENLAYAEKATAHMARYLESDPNDAVITAMMTRIWMDSGHYERALAYWESRLEKYPTDIDVLQTLAGINRQAGRFSESVRWLHRRAEVSDTPDGKVGAYLEIARLSFHRLDSSKDRPAELERLEVADVGIAALQQADALRPDSTEVHGYLGSLYERRALAHGASWAQAADLASAQHHRRRWRALTEASKPPAPPAEDGSSQAPPAKQGG